MQIDPLSVRLPQNRELITSMRRTGEAEVVSDGINHRPPTARRLLAAANRWEAVRRAVDGCASPADRVARELFIDPFLGRSLTSIRRERFGQQLHYALKQAEEHTGSLAVITNDGRRSPSVVCLAWQARVGGDATLYRLDGKSGLLLNLGNSSFAKFAALEGDDPTWLPDRKTGKPLSEADAADWMLQRVQGASAEVHDRVPQRRVARGSAEKRLWHTNQMDEFISRLEAAHQLTTAAADTVLRVVNVSTGNILSFAPRGLPGYEYPAPAALLNAYGELVAFHPSGAGEMDLMVGTTRNGGLLNYGHAPDRYN